MGKIKHVFAATDLSECALHAVDRGFQIARATGARYTVMHALGLDALGPLKDLFGDNRIWRKEVQKRKGTNLCQAQRTSSKKPRGKIHMWGR